MSQSILVLSGVLENITIGEILVYITFFAGAALAVKKVKDAVESVKTMINNWVSEELKPEFTSINERLDKLERRNERQDLENCKNYLVLFLADIERNNVPDEVEILRFEEQYNYYTKKGGNSYIHRKYEKLKAEGKL